MFFNQLTSLDLSTNTVLEDLRCRSNLLTTLDFSTNLALEQLLCDTNQLTTLDLGGQTVLRELWCGYNQLTNLNVKNGNNANFIYFGAQNNPNLACIQVDNVNYSTNNWTNIDATATFNTVCAPSSTANLGEELSNVLFYPNPTTDNLTIQLPNLHSTVQLTIKM